MDRLEKIIDWIAFALPRPAAHAASNVLGSAYFRILQRNEFMRTSKNIRDALGSEVKNGQAERIADRSFRVLCRSIADYQYFATRKYEAVARIAENMDCVGLEYLESVAKEKRGAVIVSLHMLDFFTGFLKLSQIVKGVRTVNVIKCREWSKKEAAAYGKFEKSGIKVKVHRLGNKPGIEVLRELRSGGVVFTLCDFDPAFFKTCDVRFFGRPSLLPSGPAELAISSKGVIIPVFTARDRNGKVILQVEEPIDGTMFRSHGDMEEKKKEMTQVVASRMEKWIRKYPEQWQFWPLLERIWQKN